MKDLILILLTLAAFALVYYAAVKVDNSLNKKRKSKSEKKKQQGVGPNSSYGNYRG